jgi:hypothetical protein
MQGRNPEIRYRRDLWQLFADVPLGELGGAAEIGVAEGNFSEDIFKWPIQFPFVYLVDRWRCMSDLKGDSAQPQIWHDKNYYRVVLRTARFASRVVILKNESDLAAYAVQNRSLHLVYVDADHSYQGVMGDIRAWFPKLKQGGVMAFHDYQNSAYGVKRAVDGFCEEMRFTVFELPEDKAEDAGAYFQCD